MFALVDCNNFFVSCEKVFRPDLEERPIVVLSNNDSCVIARSNEAKLLGIPMGAPLFEIRHLIKAYNIETLSCNFELYSDISRRIMNVLQSLQKNVEIYSIDEAFLELDATINWAEEGDKIHHQILKYTGIPTSIGFAPTKTLAKLATSHAKTLGSSYYIDHTPPYHKFLKATSISKIWGVGAKLTKSFKQHGICNAYDLMTADPSWVRRNYNIVAERIVRELNGFSCLPLTLVQEQKKSLQITRSFPHPIRDKENLKQIAARFGMRLGFKLRELSQKTSALTVYTQHSFSGDQSLFFQQHTVVLADSTNTTSVIIQQVQEIIENFFSPNTDYQKIGIIATDLREENLPHKHALFDSSKALSNKPNVDKVMDEINKRFGLGTIHPLSCAQSTEWVNKSHNKSPAYTTNWTNLVHVKAQ